MRVALLTAGLLLMGMQAAAAKSTTTAGVDLAVALPIIAGSLAVYKDDWVGVEELGLTGIATVGVAYGLKHVIREQRPDGSDFQSMPSDTAALAFAPAQFLWDRYGWQYGLPAYAAATFVAYSRVDARKHHWYDVTASAALAFGFGKIFDSRYHPRGLDYGAYVLPDGGGATLQYRF